MAHCPPNPHCPPETEAAIVANEKTVANTQADYDRARGASIDGLQDLNAQLLAAAAHMATRMFTGRPHSGAADGLRCKARLAPFLARGTCASANCC